MKSTSVQCIDGRGNYHEDDDGSTEYEIYEELPSTDVINGRDCVGCGDFGEPVSNNITIYYDYDDKDTYMSNFQSAFYGDDDESDRPYVCNPRFACVVAFDGSGRGMYDPDNYIAIDEEERELGIMACRAACNDGKCDYAIDCRCISECGGDVPEVCDGLEIGEHTGTCTKAPSGRPYYPDVCGTECAAVQASDDLRFRCDDPEENPDSDCLNCSPLCDGKRSGDVLDSCAYGENPAVRDQCNHEGQVIDRTESGGRKRCIHDELMGCEASYDCHNVLIGNYARDSAGEVRVDGGEHPYFATICGESCTLEDSNVCWRHEDNSVALDCHDKEPGSGFSSHGPRSIYDSYCTFDCGVRVCPGNFAYKGGEECKNNPSDDMCCYDVSYLEEKTHYEVCNYNNPDTEYEGCKPA